MSVTRFNCPECESVLKPSKPLPEGKKIKCPKCGAGIVVPGTPEKAVTAKPSASPAKSPSTTRKKSVQEEDGGGTYGVVQEPESEIKRREEEAEEQRRREEEKKEEDYDPRGPAQAAVTRPSNQMFALGVIGAISWFIIGFLLLLLTCFPKPKGDPDDEDPHPDWRESLQLVSALNPGQIPNDPDPASRSSSFLDTIGLTQVMRLPVPLRLIICVILLGLSLYGGVIVYGAVKLQKMESRIIPVITSVMVMIPINVGPLMLISAALMMIVVNSFGDLLGWLGYILGFVLLAIVVLGELAWGVYVGVWTLITIARPEVVEGFEYVPD